MVGLVGGFGVLFGDLFGVFPLGLERDSFFVPIVNGGGDGVHGHNSVHEGGRDGGGEISNEDILISDACEGRVVFEVRNILNEGRGVGVVLSLSHTFSGEPGDGITGGIVVFECSFEFQDKIGESSYGYGGSGDGVLPKGGCPGEGGSFGHVGQGEGNLLVIVIVDFFINKEVELYGVQPLSGLVVRSIKGFWCSNVEFSGF